MKINKLHLLWNMAALLLCASAASCSQDDLGIEQGEPLPPGKYPLTLTATVDGMNTRSTGKDTWAEGDRIGVRIGADGAKGCYELDYEKGSVKEVHTPVYWQSTAPATVTAWYPFEAQTAKDITDQSEGYKDIDFLKATAENKKFTDKVNLSFIHQMAKVSYTLKKGDGITDNDITDNDLKEATVQIAGYTKVSFSEGKLAGTDDGWITPASDNDALLVPKNMTGRPFIKVSISGKDFIYTPGAEDVGNLQAGCQHFYTITLKANGIEVTAAKGGEWTEGGSEDVGSTNVQNSYATDDIKPGDFFYSDGTWSDGGLRTIYADGTYRIDATAAPSLGKTVIGIVFRAGQHFFDDTDYTSTGIGQQKCRGYVVALTDVHNDDSDCLRWELKPNGQSEQIVGTSTITVDWQGYSNSLKFHEFVNNNNNKGWEMKHFPAAFACETYGKRTLDQNGASANGKYDWQQPLVAPSTTSGWFLPSCGQLSDLYANRSLLSARMDVVRNSVPVGCSYKGKIKWFSTSLYYWSSTERKNFPSYVWNVGFEKGDPGSGLISNTYAVRAVLAF